MISTPKPPPAPDPVATAQAQTAMNKETAISQTGLNAMNQIGPDGSLTYSQSGAWADGTPRFTATQTLSPDQQRLKDLSNATSINLGQTGVEQSKRIGDLLSTPYDISQGAINGRIAGMSPVPVATDTHRRFVGTDAPAIRALPDPTLVDRQNIGSNNELAGNLFAAGMTRLGPQLAERREGAESLLANKGLTVGSTGYERGMRDVAQGENDALNSLFLGGQQQAFDQSATRANSAFGQDLSRFGQFFGQSAQKSQQEFDQDLAGRNYTMAASQQNFGQDLAANESFFNQRQAAYGDAMAQRAAALQELQAQRNQPLNEIAALMSGSQVSPQSFVNTPQSQVQPTDYTGLVSNIYRGQIDGYKSQAAARGQMFDGLGSLFGGAASLWKASDRRLKSNIRPVGHLANSLTVYSYMIGGRAEIGLMADEVAAVRPDAVAEMPNGFLAVNYARATEA